MKQHLVGIIGGSGLYTLQGLTNIEEYNVVEMTHHIWLLALVDLIIAKKGK